MPPEKIPSREITPPELYYDRRTIMRAGIAAASVGLTGWMYRQFNRPGFMNVEMPELAGVIAAPETPEAFAAGYNLREEKTSKTRVGNYNNFYEFTTDKEDVSAAAARFVAKPWQLEVGGMVHKPRTFDLDDLMKRYPLEERVYRMRCVEAWSMVIPWVGFPLSKLLASVELMGDAKYVAFETLHDPARMPGQKNAVLQWPYVEGLRIDEAMHPLTLIAVGLYGQELPPQNGAPLRLVVPWKYGFKGIKSIVKITLVSTKPTTSWNRNGPGEYGFYANVNPEVPHPRWSQSTEQRIGESGRRPTLPFNGYADQVAKLYTGMNLRENY